jgi:hypothetical protein
VLEFFPFKIKAMSWLPTEEIPFIDQTKDHFVGPSKKPAGSAKSKSKQTVRIQQNNIFNCLSNNFDDRLWQVTLLDQVHWY